MLRPLAAVAAALATTAALAAPAAAAERATPAQKRQIAKAMRASAVGGIVPARWYTVIDARVSSLSSSWAAAGQRPTKAGEGKFQPATVILVRPAGQKRWVLVDIGTAFTGCGIAPNSVLADLMDVPRADVCLPDEGIPNS
jgi:hypothetical protein